MAQFNQKLTSLTETWNVSSNVAGEWSNLIKDGTGKTNDASHCHDAVFRKTSAEKDILLDIPFDIQCALNWIFGKLESITLSALSDS